MTTSISNLSIQLFSTANLQNELTNINQLNQQLASGQQQSNLTDYSPLDAEQLLNFQSAITQRQSYISSMQAVNARLQVYNNTMGDMESIASQANELATQNPTLDASQTGNIGAQVKSYMQQVVDDLNQKVGDRYIYAGTRYSTQPVNLNAVLNGQPPSSFVNANNLPPYDTDYGPSNSFTINSTPSGSFQVGDVSIKWSDIAAGGALSTIYVNGVATTPSPAITLPNTSATTPTELAQNVAAAINALATDGDPNGTDFQGLTATASSGTVSLAAAGSPESITPDSGGSTGKITWSDNTDGTSAETMGATDTAAWTQDSAIIDTSNTLTYGVTSTQTGFQQLIAGMQYINAATQSGVTAAQYQSDMAQAGQLLSSALTNIQTYNTGVASATNNITQEQTTQNTDITNLQIQIGNIQNVDVAQVGTELNTLQAQLQASYSATAALTQDSILKYL